jgi:hypothetical protein
LPTPAVRFGCTTRLRPPRSVAAARSRAPLPLQTRPAGPAGSAPPPCWSACRGLRQAQAGVGAQQEHSRAAPLHSLPASTLTQNCPTGMHAPRYPPPSHPPSPLHPSGLTECGRVAHQGDVHVGGGARAPHVRRLHLQQVPAPYRLLLQRDGRAARQAGGTMSQAHRDRFAPPASPSCSASVHGACTAPPRDSPDGTGTKAGELA